MDRPTPPRATEAPSGTSRRVRHRDSERGIVLLWATISVVLIAGVVFAATDRLNSVHELTNAEFSSMGQARAIARAGLTDAVAWLRRKTTQPVSSFTPARDPRLPPPDAAATDEAKQASAQAAASDPIDADESPRNETEDASVGIVRSFEISPGVWGRYSVVRGTNQESWNDTNGNGIYDPDESFTDTNEDGKWTPGQWTRDLTTERGLPGSGAVWFLACRGEVFARPNADAPLNAGGNKRIAETLLGMEVRRLTIAPPANAAVVAREGRDISVGLRARIRGDTALAYRGSTGLPSTSGGELLGSAAPIQNMALSIEEVFGVSLPELKSMSDLSTSDPVNGLPKVLPDFSLSVVTGNVTFHRQRPLRGNGVLVVKGDVTIESGSNTFFRGVLFVDGNLTARAPAYLRGTVMCTGEVDLRGTGGDFCEVEHDEAIVSLLLTHMGQYRISKAPFTPQPKMIDGRASDLGISRRRFGGVDVEGDPTGTPSPDPDPDPTPDPDPDPDPTPDPDPEPTPDPDPDPTPDPDPDPTPDPDPEPTPDPEPEPDPDYSDTMNGLVSDVKDLIKESPKKSKKHLRRARDDIKEARDLLDDDDPEAAAEYLEEAIDHAETAGDKGADVDSLLEDLNEMLDALNG